MKLSSVEVNDFKSIRRSTPFGVGQITCLVGKNDSGKTSLLQALYKLNPVVPEHGSFDVTDEYPRAVVEEYQQQVENGETNPAIVVKAVYTLEPSEITSVEEVYGKGVLPKSTLVVSKGYENRLYVGIETDEAAAVKGLVRAYKVPGEVATRAVALEDLQSLKDFLDRDGAERGQKHRAARAEADAVADPNAKTKAVHEADTLAESEAAKKLKGRLIAILQGDFGVYIWTNHL